MVKINYIENKEKKVIEVDTEDKSNFENIFMTIITFYPFQIKNKEQRKKWNNYVEENFIYLDDDCRDLYQPPYLDTNKWCVYEGGYLKKIKNAIKGSEQYLDYLKSINNIINS